MLSMSTSLVAVFIPILLMAGIVGRLFREFAVTLSIAVGSRSLVSLTTTPMMCAQIPASGERQAQCSISFRRARLDALYRLYDVCFALGLAASADGAGHHDHHVLCEHLSLCDRAQRLFPAGRYRPAFLDRSSAIRISSYTATTAKMMEFAKIIEADPAD